MIRVKETKFKMFLKELGLIKRNFLEKAKWKNHLVECQGYALPGRREMNVLNRVRYIELMD